MITIKGKYGITYFIDCMNKIYGMPSLKAGTVDLCITDPPYDLGFDNTIQQDMSKRRSGKEITRVPVNLYNDKIPNYDDWSRVWFAESRRICKWTVFTCGTSPTNMKMWLNIEVPAEIQTHYKPNCASHTHISRFLTSEPLLVYGKFKPFTFVSTAVNIPLNNGFLRRDEKTKHGSPKSPKLWDYYIRRIKPKTVIDPFCGSGITQLICESLGIHYICYEVDEIHYDDIEDNVRTGERIKKATGRIKKLRSYGSETHG